MPNKENPTHASTSKLKESINVKFCHKNKLTRKLNIFIEYKSILVSIAKN